MELNVVLSVTKPAPEQPTMGPVESRWHNGLSAAMMAGIAFLPIVIAAGFLAEHFQAPSVPNAISTAALRGPIDGDRPALADRRSVDRGAERSSVRVRAGF